MQRDYLFGVEYVAKLIFPFNFLKASLMGEQRE